MTLLPSHYETFVLTQSSDEVVEKLSRATSSKILLQNQEKGLFQFSGWVKRDRFRISLKIHRPNNYVPLIVGRVETTSTGCLVFVSYRLFPVTKMFLLFWSLFAILAGVFASYQYDPILYGILSLFILGAIHWITWSNFRIQLKVTRQTLLEVLI